MLWDDDDDEFDDLDGDEMSDPAFHDFLDSNSVDDEPDGPPDGPHDGPDEYGHTDSDYERMSAEYTEWLRGNDTDEDRSNYIGEVPVTGTPTGREWAEGEFEKYCEGGDW